MTSKQKSLEKIKEKNKKEEIEGIERVESFKKEVGVNRGDYVTCTRSFKVGMLPGGFRVGNKYKVLGVGPNVVYIMDDENAEHDPMELNLIEFKKYFT